VVLATDWVMQEQQRLRCKHLEELSLSVERVDFRKYPLPLT
jgi:hypothetical protein